MKRVVKKPLIYWLVNIMLIGPVILMWGGVAYWFGFASEVLLKTIFPRTFTPLLFSTLLLSGFAWTVCHLIQTPRDQQNTRRTDIAICVFITFSVVLVAGQIMGL